MNENNKYININETRDIIYILGNLCLEYIADMDSFDKEIDNIKRQYNKHYLCLINYCVENKRYYFEEGIYNYNLIP